MQIIQTNWPPTDIVGRDTHLTWRIEVHGLRADAELHIDLGQNILVEACGGKNPIPDILRALADDLERQLNNT